MPARSRGSVSARFSVWLSRARAAPEPREVGLEDLDAAGIVLAESVLAAHEVEGGPALRAGLGQDQGPGGEVQGAEADPPGRSGARRPPVKPARDHQVDDREALALERDGDALAQAAEADHRPPGQGLGRGLDGAQHEGAQQTDALQAGAADARVQRLDVDGDVGQLGHRVSGGAADTGGLPPAVL